MRGTIIPYLLSASALAVALVALLGPRPQSAAAGSLIAQIGPAVLGGGFTYQGSLSRGGTLVNGIDACDMRFSLWDAANGGAQLGSSQTVSAVDFTQGLFTVTLNEAGQFGPTAFSGDARWLEVEMACPPGGAYTTLGRQAITAVPYASSSQSTQGLQGRPVSAAEPGSGQALAWNGTAWAPSANLTSQSTQGLQGRAVSGAAPLPGYVLAWNGISWSPAPDAEGVRYERTVVVTPFGHQVSSGARLFDALAAITDASADKPYLLKIEPGVYDLTTRSLQMKPYVDIEGSGQGVTLIRGERRADDSTGIIIGADNAELRELSVSMTTGDGPFAIAISNNNASPRITDVTIRVDGPTSYGILNRNGASPWIERVTAQATGASVLAAGLAHFGGGTPTIVDGSLRADATAQGNSAGISVVGNAVVTVLGGYLEGGGTTSNFNLLSAVRASDGATVRVHNARLKAVQVGFRFDSATILIAGSELALSTTALIGTGFSTIRCVGSYLPDFRPVNSICIPSS